MQIAPAVFLPRVRYQFDCCSLCPDDHFVVVSDDRSLPLVTFRLNEKKKRTYTECAFNSSLLASVYALNMCEGNAVLFVFGLCQHGCGFRFDIADRLRERGWVVPACEIPCDRDLAWHGGTGYETRVCLS